MSIDLSSSRDPADLVDALWQARRENRHDLLPSVLALLDHSDPTVREEVVSLVFVKWQRTDYLDRLEKTLRKDRDEGVRARAVGALAIMCEHKKETHAILTLRDLVLNRHESELVRKAAYEGLVKLKRDQVTIIGDDTDIDEDIDFEWVKSIQ